MDNSMLACSPRLVAAAWQTCPALGDNPGVPWPATDALGRRLPLTADGLPAGVRLVHSKVQNPSRALAGPVIEEMKSSNAKRWDQS